jgi:hypothetical protein
MLRKRLRNMAFEILITLVLLCLTFVKLEKNYYPFPDHSNPSELSWVLWDFSRTKSEVCLRC